jgi:hypothetical protein
VFELTNPLQPLRAVTIGLGQELLELVNRSQTLLAIAIGLGEERFELANRSQTLLAIAVGFAITRLERLDLLLPLTAIAVGLREQCLELADSLQPRDAVVIGVAVARFERRDLLPLLRPFAPQCIVEREQSLHDGRYGVDPVTLSREGRALPRRLPSCDERHVGGKDGWFGHDAGQADLLEQAPCGRE